MTSMINAFIKRWFPLILWLGVIFFFSANPDPYRFLPTAWLKPFNVSDKSISNLDEVVGILVHLSEYFILGFLLFRTWTWDRSIKQNDFTWVLVFVFLFALSDEIHQVFVPGRAFQFLDLGLDMIGATLGALCFRRRTRVHSR